MLGLRDFPRDFVVGFRVLFWDFGIFRSVSTDSGRFLDFSEDLRIFLDISGFCDFPAEFGICRTISGLFVKCWRFQYCFATLICFGRFRYLLRDFRIGRETSGVFYIFGEISGFPGNVERFFLIGRILDFSRFVFRFPDTWLKSSPCETGLGYNACLAGWLKQGGCVFAFSLAGWLFGDPSWGGLSAQTLAGWFLVGGCREECPPWWRPYQGWYASQIFRNAIFEPQKAPAAAGRPHQA